MLLPVMIRATYAILGRGGRKEIKGMKSIMPFLCVPHVGSIREKTTHTHAHTHAYAIERKGRVGYGNTTTITATTTTTRHGHRHFSIWSNLTNMLTVESDKAVEDLLLFPVPTSQAQSQTSSDSKAVKLGGIERIEIDQQAPQVRGMIHSWKMFNDADYGGESKTDLEYLIENISRPSVSIDTATAAPTAVVPFLRMTGHVYLSPEIKKKHKVVGGFCAYKGDIHLPPIDLRDYEGLELIVRTSKDKQSFTLNIGVEGMVEGDVYQLRMELQGQQGQDQGKGNGNCTVGSHAWKQVHVPFNRFIVTSKGIVREQQRTNDSLQVEHIGILFKDEDQEQDQDHEKKVQPEPNGKQCEQDKGNGYQLDIRSITVLSSCPNPKSKFVL